MYQSQRTNQLVVWNIGFSILSKYWCKKYQHILICLFLSTDNPEPGVKHGEYCAVLVNSSLAAQHCRTATKLLIVPNLTYGKKVLWNKASFHFCSMVFSIMILSIIWETEHEVIQFNINFFSHYLICKHRLSLSTYLIPSLRSLV